MRELLTHPLFNITLGCSVILWLGLVVATRISNTPAKAHGTLVLSLVGAVFFPIVYLLVGWADWGLLDPLPEDLSFSTLIRGGPELSPPGILPAQSPPPSENPPPLESLLQVPASPSMGAGTLSPELRNSNKDQALQDLPSEKNTLGDWAFSVLSWKVLRPYVLGSLWGFLGIWCFLTLVALVNLIRGLFGTFSLAGAGKTYQEANAKIQNLAQLLGLSWIPKLVEHGGIKTPAVAWPLGSWPVVLIPRGVAPDNYSNSIFLHELAHLKRLDHCWTAFANLALALFPWNPFAHRARKNLLRFAEMASDDWVVACGGNPADYAEELLSLADPDAPPFSSILPVAYKENDLKDRILRLVGEQKIPSPRLGTIRALLGSTCLIAGLFGIAFLQPAKGHFSGSDFSGQDRANRNALPGQEKSLGFYPSTGSTTLRVRSLGRPAENAKVWVEILDKEKFSFLGPVPTNGDGEAKFPVFAEKIQAVFAVNDQGRYGWKGWVPGPKPMVDFYLDLLEPSALKMQVFHDGNPVEGIQVEMFGVEPLEYFGKVVRLPPGFPIAAGTTNQVGEMEVSPVFPNCRNCFQVKSSRFPNYQIRSIPNEVTKVHLEQPGILEVHFRGEGKPPSLEALIWSLTGQNRGKRQEMGQNLDHDPSSRNPNLSGNQIKNLAPGLHSLYFVNGGATPYTLENQGGIMIKPGQITHVEIPYQKPASIQGRLVDANTGKGISHLLLAVMANKKGEFVPFKQEVVETDERGEFRCFVQGGFDYSVVFLDHLHDAERYQHKYPHELAGNWKFPLQPKPGETIRIPDLPLIPSGKFRGTVRNLSPELKGQELEIYCPVKPSRNPDYMANFKVTGNQFEITGVPPGIPLNVRLRHGGAVNVPDFLNNQDPGVDQAFVLEERNAVTMQGEVQSQSGGAIPDAKVKLFWFFPVQGNAGKLFSRRLMETTKTGPDGKFQFSGYWPGDEYYIEVEAPAFKPLTGNYNHRFAGDPGKIVDLGIQKLTPLAE